MYDKVYNLYKDELKNYKVFTIDGIKYYEATVDGVKVRMSSADFDSPSSAVSWVGNSPINKAIDGLKPEALVVLIDAAHKNNIDTVQISSMYRNNPTLYGENDPHSLGNAIDVSKMWQGNTEYDFSRNLSTVGENITAPQFQGDIFDTLRNDSRVRQIFDPWDLQYNRNSYSQNLGQGTYKQIPQQHFTHLHIGI